MKLSKRSQMITASPTLAISGKAKLLKSQGEPIISFGAGEPDFDTPDFIKNAAKKALDEGFTKYTPSSGTLELKKAICDKFLKDNNLKYEPNQIIVSNGAKHSLFNALFSMCDEGDEVIIFSPYWVTYVEQIKLAGGVPKIVVTKASNNFKIDIDDLKRAVNNKTKAIMINSPSNPTGALCSSEDLKAIADIAVSNDLYVISDEIYEKIIYSGEHVSIASFGEDIKDRTIVINGVSKSYSMTGWRIGYSASNPSISSAINNIQSHATSNPNSIAQKAAYAALLADYDFDKIVEKFRERRDYIVEALNSIENVKCFNPGGAFYVFPDISAYLGKEVDGKKLDNTIEFCKALLDKAKIAVIPGIAFGDDACIRFSYALGLEEIKEGINRFKDFLKN